MVGGITFGVGGIDSGIGGIISEVGGISSLANLPPTQARSIFPGSGRPRVIWFDAPASYDVPEARAGSSAAPAAFTAEGRDARRDGRSGRFPRRGDAPTWEASEASS